MQISLEQARHAAINAQLLGNKNNLAKGKEGVYQVIEKLGYIQIDTISVIERAHHHTIWTRRPDYKPEFLDKLQAKDKKIFEYWGHAASYLPLSDYRYYLQRMRSFQDPQGKWMKEMSDKCSHLMAPVLNRIHNEGALGAKDFETLQDAKKGSWWDWRPTKMALEMLFGRGDLMVKERKGFQKIYDLPGRVLPTEIDTTFPSDEESGRFFVSRALAAYGIASQRDIQNHIHTVDKKAIHSALKKMLKSGEVTAIAIETLDKKEYFALSTNIDNFNTQDKPGAHLHILSPFDNMVILRDRIKELFGFDYTLECYVPPAKRKYGYFSLPILWSDKFIARMDSKADRGNKMFIVRNLFFEPDFKDYDAVLPALYTKLNAFVEFNRCRGITIEKTEPAKLKKILARMGKERLGQ